MTGKKQAMSFFATISNRATVSTSKSNVLIMYFWKKMVEGVRSLEKKNQSLIRNGLNLMGKYESGTNRKCYSREVETDKLSLYIRYALFSQLNTRV